MFFLVKFCLDLSKLYQANKQSNLTQKNNTNKIVIIGFLAFVFSMVFPFVGFILAIIGISQTIAVGSKNKRKFASLKRDLISSERTNKYIGVGFCVIALIIAIIRMIIGFVSSVVMML